MGKVCVIGHFGFGKTLLNGQTVKANNLIEGIEQYSFMQICKIDSHGWIKHPCRLLRQIQKAFAACDCVVMLPAHNGVRVFAPVLLRYKKKYGKKIFYDVIGGWLPEFVKERKALQKTLKSFDGIWVETQTMKGKLIEQGFENVTVVPNFKKLTPLTEDQLVYSQGTPYRLCTFSRVMKEKGIEDAVNAVKAVNETLGKTAYTLDIYGQVDGNEKQWFEDLQKTFPEYIRYAGMVPSDQSVAVLKDYFALLFPTFYPGEGFAGTLIDAFCAGVPVVATDWRYNTELVSDATGFLYPTGDMEGLVRILHRLADDPTLALDKKKDCLAEGKKYQAETVIGQLIRILESE